MAAYPLRFEMIWSILPAGKKDKEGEKKNPPAAEPTPFSDLFAQREMAGRWKGVSLPLLSSTYVFQFLLGRGGGKISLFTPIG
jgi:hypothetical protein